MLDANKAKLTKTGKITITADEIIVEGFEGDGTSCRDLAVLAMMWGIGELQKDVVADLQEPGGGKSCIG